MNSVSPAGTRHSRIFPEALCLPLSLLPVPGVGGWFCALNHPGFCQSAQPISFLLFSAQTISGAPVIGSMREPIRVTLKPMPGASVGWNIVLPVKQRVVGSIPGCAHN